MATPIGQIPLRKKGQSTCIEHKGRQLVFYCKTCDILVCMQCLSSTHQGHNLCELDNITSQKKQDIQEFINRSEQNDLVVVSKYISSMDTLLKDNSTYFEQLSNQLKIQTEKLKHDLDMLTANTLSTYHEMEKDNAMLIQTYRKDLEMYEKQLKQRVRECKTVLQRCSNIELYDVGCEICSKINLPAKPVLCTTSFTPNKAPQHHLELALGKMVSYSSQGQASTGQDRSVQASSDQDPSSTSHESELKGQKTAAKYKLLPQTKVLEEWESPVGISSICPTTDGQVWTNRFGDTLTLLDRKVNIIQEVKHNTDIQDICMSPPTHTLWACDIHNNILELVSGQLTHRFSTKEFPRCICVTASNHVIVGMTNDITKFTTQGEEVLSTSATGTGMSLVCTPHRISECPVTHNVAVIDSNNLRDGGDRIRKVTVMDNDFKELFVYRGAIPSIYKQASHKAVRPFYPYGVAFDSVGNIIIGDSNNKRVLLISGRGEFFRIIHTDLTLAVGVDREDVLWTVSGGLCRNVKLLQYSSV